MELPGKLTVIISALCWTGVNAPRIAALTSFSGVWMRLGDL